MSTQSSHPWEPWQLTAYILGELEAEESQRLADAIAADAALGREVADLAATLKDVRAVYRQEKIAQNGSCGLNEKTLSALLAGALPATAAESDRSPAQIARSHSKQNGKLYRHVWLTLAAMLLVGITVGVLWRSAMQPKPAATTLARSDNNAANVAKKLPTGAPIDALQDVSEQREPLASEADAPTERAETNMAASPPEYDQGESDNLAAVQLSGLEGRSSQSVQRGAAAQASTQPGADSLDASGSMGYGGSVAAGGAAGMGSYGMGSSMSGAGGIGGYGMSIAPSEAAPGLAGQPAQPSQAAQPAQAGDYGSTTGEAQVAAAAASTQEATMFGDMQGTTASGLATGLPADPFGGSVPADPATRTAGGMRGDPAMGMMGMGDRGMPDSGMGPGASARVLSLGSGLYGGRRYAAGDQFAPITENDFAQVRTAPLSTFSIDVDTASFAKARQYLLEHGQLPPAGAVRIEEFINYFDYDYAGPEDDTPFASALAVTECPWQPEHKLVRIALQAKKVELSERPKANLVFLLDVSGSMDEPNKLPLVKETMRLLTYQLGENDRVAMVVYAGAAGCVLESTRGDKQDQILSAIERLSAGGSTNGGAGIKLAYSLARDHFIPGGINRVILCTDGDFNVGVTGTEELVDLVAENAKSNVFLTVLGYGMGNTNDAMMEQVSNRGNGVYGFVDSRSEAQRQMVRQLTGNLMTVAKDVKIQVEFNPAMVRSYRLIGYENRRLATEDFSNDKKDAGEIGAGHRVTALYEIVPTAAGSDDAPADQPLKYQPLAASEPTQATSDSRELLTVNLRYKQPEGDKSSLLTFPLADSDLAYTDADRDFRWAAAVAEFGMLLRGSQHRGNASWDALARRARMAVGPEPDAARSDCLEMIRIASQHSPQRDPR